MIYITGDCHSDFMRFEEGIFPEQREMTKEDYVIICGDCGGVWQQENGRYIKQENRALDVLNERSFTTLFVDGNPAGVKAMLNAMGMIENKLRLPLVPTRITTFEAMRKILNELNIKC